MLTKGGRAHMCSAGRPLFNFHHLGIVLLQASHCLRNLLSRGARGNE